IDALAVTVGAGLAPALEVGIAKIKELAKKYKKPVIAVNHMEAHFLSSLAKNSQGNGPFSRTKIQFPVLGLLVSGGHTQLVLMKKIGLYQLLGETIDDAAGEAFDKVAKMLNLGYPGGPIISEFAKKGKPVYGLPLAMADSKNLNYSFSGLKTACLYKIRDLAKEKKFNKQFYYDFAASFEDAVIKSLMLKFKRAIVSFKPKQVFLGGGVISNERLRRSARKVAKEYGIRVFQPYSEKLFTDNGAMVGICAFYQAQRGDFVKDIEKLDRQPNLNF
ncbi:MAG: tRNA (adenosine(37)-N6)-threonylcarbamoyltransferase complex transferase subunit TsaD, partial [bacterium]|nr:tRNA (adenosine(37)-N6)-threonylcarbamoyltransferase complex transferase subunit TsaD [bacterium]